MKSKIAMAIAATTIALATQAQAAKQTVCVWDIMGTGGDVYRNAQDYALKAKGWGADLLLKVYTDERVAAEDFKAGQCDAAMLSGIRGRQFNTFIGSIDSIGSVPSNKVAFELMNVLSSPKLAAKMVQGNYEVAGVTPVGSVFLLVNDRSINTLAKAAGKKIAVLDYDKSQAKMVQRVGAQPVASEITNFAGKFNNGQVDIVVAPAIAFKPLELYKGLGTKGAVARFPIAQFTGDIIIRKDKFPEGYGQKSRDYVASQLPTAIKLIAKQEADIPAKYWMDIPAADQVGYVKLMREARLELTKEGIYNKDMMSLLKKVRCKVDPSSFECALTDE